MVVLQVLCHYEFMIEIGPLVSENQVKKSMSCVASPHLTRLGERALHIDYKETFSPVSTKDSFRTIMALVAHFDLELHHMDVKTMFLNSNIDETIYMVQLENFVSRDPKSMVCKLKKFIYGLKQAFHQWYQKFHQVITSNGFEVNLVEDCVYHKFNE